MAYILEDFSFLEKIYNKIGQFKSSEPKLEKDECFPHQKKVWNGEIWSHHSLFACMLSRIKNLLLHVNYYVTELLNCEAMEITCEEHD